MPLISALLLMTVVDCCVKKLEGIVFLVTIRWRRAFLRSGLGSADGLRERRPAVFVPDWIQQVAAVLEMLRGEKIDQRC